jgi:hypothetical protein
MIKINYDLVEKKGMTSSHVHAKNNTKTHVKHSIRNLEPRSTVLFHTLIGTLQGHLEKLSKIYFSGEARITIRNGSTKFEGEITVYWENDGILANHIFEEIDGCGYALAHGFLGEYEINATFSQTCEIKRLA